MRKSLGLAVAGLAACGPTTALRATSTSPEISGLAQVNLQFNNDGRLTACTIVRSTGNADLDRKTCDLIRVCAAKTRNPKKALETCSPQMAGTKSKE